MRRRTARLNVRVSSELQQELYAVAQAQGFSSPSAFIRVALERELRRQPEGSAGADERLAASIDRLRDDLRRLSKQQQALFALLDALVKTVLTCLPEPTGDTYQMAVARAKARYERFLRSAGSGMLGNGQDLLREIHDSAQ